MIRNLINREFYDSIINFESDEAAQDYYYKIMDTETERNGRMESIRTQILRSYCMLFCEDIGAKPGQVAGPDEVEATADRLYIGRPSFDPTHWYRMRYHFPVIDDDNYDRFAALVIADLNAGPLREAVLNDGDMLLVGAANPLGMTRTQRENQEIRTISIGAREK